MATCKDCGKTIGNFVVGGKCSSCAKASFGQMKTEEEIIAEAMDYKIGQVLLTTETQSDLKILKRIEVISAEVAFGMNIFKDLFVEVRNIVGGRSKAVQDTMREARRTALYELKREAHEIGANAVVGVDLDYVELSAHSTMVMLVATGTAVVIEQ